MELTLNVYKAKGKYIISNEIERVARAQDFELSTGVCEDILNLIQIDTFAGGYSALTDEGKQELAIDIIKDGYPMFLEIIKEIFEFSDDEAKRLKIADVIAVVLEIVKYSFAQLSKSLGGNKNSKN